MKGVQGEDTDVRLLCFVRLYAGTMKCSFHRRVGFWMKWCIVLDWMGLLGEEQGIDLIDLGGIVLDVESFAPHVRFLSLSQSSKV